MARKDYPLRKIIEVLEIGHFSGWYQQQKVLLECGHETWVSTKTTYQARCVYCKKKENDDGKKIKVKGTHDGK